MSGEAALRQVVPHELLVWACGVSATQRARLVDALRGTACMRELHGGSELAERLRQTEAPDLVVLAVDAEDGRDAAALIRLVVSSRRRAAVVAYCNGRGDRVPNLAALAAAGVHQFVFTGINDSGIDLRAILEAARQQCAADIVLSGLRPLLPEALHPMVEAALARPAVVVDVAALADALGVHRKTLFNRCTRTCRLLPAELLAWTRLALVAYLLESTASTVETIAIELAYPSATALRNAIKRYTGKRATEIRAGGGLPIVLEALRVHVSQDAAPTPPLHLV